MGETITVGRKELTAAEIIDELDAGNRVIVEVGMLGLTMRMALRRQEETYYCDNSVKLLTFDDEEGMRRCLEQFRLARPESTPDVSRESADQERSTDDGEDRGGVAMGEAS